MFFILWFDMFRTIFLAKRINVYFYRSINGQNTPSIASTQLAQWLVICERKCDIRLNTIISKTIGSLKFECYPSGCVMILMMLHFDCNEKK